MFGQDPLTAPVSSRPAEVLEHAGVRGDVVVWDADDNEEMQQAIDRAAAEDRVLVGASGVLGAFARGLLGGTALVTLVYLAVNLVFLFVVPSDQLAGSTTAGADAANLLFGPRAEGLLSLLGESS